ncbi:MAG TPA: YlqD family protein [Pseudogracilibacillus sp.]|nr:YlqD family protein [Pseudogracilibacillus sp.]
MQIIKTVQVKQIMTEESKQSLQKQFELDKIQLERECEQLQFEQKKLSRKLGDSEMLRNKFRRELERRKEKMAHIQFTLDQLQTLSIGDEIVEREIDALVRVKVGSNWNDLMKRQSIVVKDGTVVRIENE